VVAFGTPLRLKKKFGKGYRLSLFSSTTRVGELIDAVMVREPSATVSRR
jgi:hypothetical protein